MPPRTLSGKSKVISAMTSPGLKVAPSLIWKCTVPASGAFKGMYIFITCTATSTEGGEGGD